MFFPFAPLCVTFFKSGKMIQAWLRGRSSFRVWLKNRMTVVHYKTSMKHLQRCSARKFRRRWGPARLWTEDQIIRFGKRDYRIVSRLGSGGVGMTFKVRELDVSTQEDQGTYVAKVAHDEKSGLNILKAYSLARSHLPGHTALSTIFEVGNEWDQNEFSALMQWIPGTPLMEFSGVFPLLAEEQQELSGEALAIRWISVICEALGVLHRNGLVHGDVVPRILLCQEAM